MQLISDIRAVRPDDLEIMGAIPGLMIAARDAELRLFWCTREFEDLVQHHH